MKFKNFRFVGMAFGKEIEGLDEGDYSVVGKLRPWDEADEEYVLYSDGDLILAEIDNTEGAQ